VRETTTGVEYRASLSSRAGTPPGRRGRPVCRSSGLQPE